ncbi:MAG: hypothetical protein WD876_00640 [Candidatus Pacearchaeota archaeon]
MIITNPIQVKKILRFTEKRKRELIAAYLSMYPEELASYYNYMGPNEKRFVDEEVMSNAPENKRKDFEFYKIHPLELRKALAKPGLEQRAE